MQDHQRGLKYALAMEHLANSMLQYRPFMQQTDWTELTDRTVVDYCNFCSSHYHKPAGMYTSQFGWKPAGKSGTGRCCHCVKTAILEDGSGTKRENQECGMCTIFN